MCDRPARLFARQTSFGGSIITAAAFAKFSERKITRVYSNQLEMIEKAPTATTNHLNRTDKTAVTEDTGTGGKTQEKPPCVRHFSPLPLQ